VCVYKLDTTDLAVGPSASCCGHGDEHSVPVTHGELNN
jgi:hypothetical protein